MDFFWAPIQPFIGHPERITIAAGVLLALFVWAWRTRHWAWPLLVAAVAWAVYAPWEWHCEAQGYNIRVDMFLIYPALLGVTLLGLLGFVPRRKRPGCCSACGYDLRGSAGDKCPECGAERGAPRDVD